MAILVPVLSLKSVVKNLDDDDADDDDNDGG